MEEFISVEEAWNAIASVLERQPAERVPLMETLGRTLAEAAVSRDAIPPFDNSAMDGYAVRSEDLREVPRRLRVCERIPAGSYPQQVVQPGTCAQIMTGAPFPEGADAVVPVEWTEGETEGGVLIRRAPQPGQHVRAAGRDVLAGSRVFEAGQVVTPPVLGMLAALGYAEAAVRSRPRVAVIATGDELVDPAEVPGPGQIRNANGPALTAQVQHAGGDPLPSLHARDDPADLKRVVEQALAAEVLVFSGGVSVGAYDHVKDVLDRMGLELLFWQVRQRPGKPLAFGTLQGKPIFGLPGNPVSSAMCFEQYVRPALACMLGRTDVRRPRYPAVLDEAVSKKAGLHHFVRGRAFFTSAGTLRVRPTGAQDSNLYSSVVRANCIVHLPEGMEDPPEGTAVMLEWLDW